MDRFPGIHDEASQANAPMDTALENKLKDQEDFLWEHDDFNHSILFHGEDEGATGLTDPKLASVEWASIIYSPIWVTRGLKSITVDLYCYVMSLEGVVVGDDDLDDHAGVELMLELRGFGSVTITIGPHAAPGGYWESITLTFDQALDADLFADLVLWYRSETEEGVHVTGFDIKRATPGPAEIQCVPSLKFSLTNQHCYVVERLNSADEVVARYQSITSESDATRIIPHTIDAFEGEQPAQYRALGYIVVRALRVRALHAPSEVGA